MSHAIRILPESFDPKNERWQDTEPAKVLVRPYDQLNAIKRDYPNQYIVTTSRDSIDALHTPLIHMDTIHARRKKVWHWSARIDGGLEEYKPSKKATATEETEASGNFAVCNR